VTQVGGYKPDVQTVRLAPQRWTALPGTNVTVWWDGEDHRRLARRVLACARLADRPELGVWPVAAVASDSIYRSRQAADRYADPVRCRSVHAEGFGVGDTSADLEPAGGGAMGFGLRRGPGYGRRPRPTGKAEISGWP
jgi:hypothetical protein